MLLGEKSPTPERTDWARLKAMTEEEIERNAREDPDNPPIEPKYWKVVEQPRKVSIHLRVDADVLEWFRENSDRHLTHMNSVLRAYRDAKLRAGGA